MAPGHPSDLRRIVDGVSLVLLQSLKRTATLQSPRDLETLLSRTVKTALVSATDLAGITSGRLRPYSISPPPPPITTNNEDNNNKDNKASVVFFSHPDTQPEPQILQLQRPSPPPLPLDNNVAASNNALVIDDSINRSLEEQDHRKNVSSTSTPNVATDSAAADHDDDAPRTTTSIPLNKRMRRPREKRVPSTPFSRALGFAGLGAGLAWGTIQESAKRVIYGTPTSTNNQSALSPFLSEQNAERLALALCRMRGAALKLGQMLSIQDESLIPAPILAALDIVRQGADVMPRSQLNDVLDAELGSDWTKKLASFDYEPLASASIGQVHRAVMKDGLVVAMKIQYPGVADSIDSDIENVRRLLNYTNLIPKGLFLDRAIKVAKDELSRECDYELEATNQKRFRELVSTTEGVYVPIVIDEISSRKVLTTELVSGIPIDKVAVLNQETRNYVGRKLLELTLKELFVFRFMQTDPNWSNFLYDETTNMINLIDFGAAREYRKGFVDDYLRMVLACANCDRDAVIEMSKRLGFLTGMESEVMLDAHVQASFIVGLPFSTAGVFDFRSSNITSSISHLGATMLKHRLTPPPDEAYSLHRKLSGAFLACIKLGVVVPCRDLLLQVYQQYRFSDENEDTLSSTA